MADGMLNWLPNVQYNKESRFYTTQDIAEGAEKIKTADKAIRDLKRKRAVEKATANAIDAKGEFNEELARKSLIDSGFGEEADALVSDITSKRVTKTNEALDLRKKIAEAVAYGTLTQDIADQILGGKPGQTVEKAPVTQATQPAEVSNTQFPQTKVPTAFDKIVNPQAQEPAQTAPTSQAFRQTQVTPAYTSFGAIDYGKMNTPATNPQKVSFDLSDNPKLRSRQIAAAEQVLSIKIPNGLTNEQISDFIDKRAESMATSQNELKPPVAFGGDLSKYKAHEVEVSSARGKAKQDILDKLAGQINTNRQLATGERQATTSEKTYVLKKGEVMADRTTPWGKGILPSGLVPLINKLAPEVQGMYDEFYKLKDILKKDGQTDPKFRETLFSLMKYTIRAKNLEASDQKLSTIENLFKSGTNIDNLIDSFEGDTQDIIRKFAKEAYRGATTDISSIESLVRSTGVEARRRVPEHNRNYNGSFFRTLPLVGEDDLDQEALKKKNGGSSQSSGGEKPQQPQKPKTANEGISKAKEKSKNKDKFKIPPELQ